MLLAVHQYREQVVSLERAARVAGLPLSQFMDVLSQLGVDNPLSLTDYLEGLEHLRQTR